MSTSDQKRAVITEEHRIEAGKLKAIYEARKADGTLQTKGIASQAALGAAHGIGGQAAVWQFLNGVAALSLKAARGFAEGLGCQIDEFSPRLAAEAAGLEAVAGTNPPMAGPTSKADPLDALADMLAALNPDTRLAVRSLLDSMAEDPSRAPRLVRTIRSLIDADQQPQEQPPEHEFIDDPRPRLPDVDLTPAEETKRRGAGEK